MIPLAYAAVEDGKLAVGPASFDGRRFSLGETRAPDSVGSLKTRERRGTVAVADVRSLNTGRFNPNLVERCKVSGNDVWLIEAVRYLADVLDAFLGSIDKLVMPYHAMPDPGLLSEAIDISDDCIPLVRCWEGRPYGAKETDVVKIVRSISDIGFVRVIVSDLDGSLPEGVWGRLAAGPADVVPYVPAGDAKAAGIAGERLKDLFPPRT